MTVHDAFVRAGFAAPVVVDEQAVPDPDFPTVAFPNPEEKGAIDLALARAREVACDLVIANDPDADRCAAAILDPATGDWRMLRGDEVGALLGAHLVARGVERRDVFANSIVSSRLLASIARAAGIRHEETLTGFKWISRVEGLRYGYEEALGYCVAPDLVRDKDGVSAALLLAELAAGLKAQGRTLSDLLDDLAAEHGVHATDSFAVRVDDLAQIDVLMGRLRAEPPASVAGIDVVAPRRPEPGRRWTAPDRRAAPPARRRLTCHRAPERHGTEGEGLPRGDRAGADPRRPRPVAGGRRDAPGCGALGPRAPDSSLGRLDCCGLAPG